MPQEKILLAHGSGGRLMHNLIKDLLLKKLKNPILAGLSDSAVIDYKDKIAFTTDSFVVNPLFFSGADIGKLCVCGTINDLVVSGAIPEYFSLSLIIEEGLEYRLLDRIIESASFAAKKAGVRFVTGDTKVVERGACDKVFINTSGIGRIVNKASLSLRNIRAHDAIIVTGNIGQHGIAVLSKRKGIDLGFNIKSDCAALNSLLIPILKKTEAIKFMRDPTRGGVATTLNEIAESIKLGILIEEKNIPVSSRIKTACELLGMDPLYIANEGVAILIVKQESAKKVLGMLKKHPLGKNAKIIGEVRKNPPGKVVLNTSVGSKRLVDMLTSEPLPRIC